ncbi:MAG: ABC transporter ATP-binding protein, partial [Phycisphaerales bacterium]|nr:ABC transporter ATP-binding protein [Phycisphaerales bacterium]
MTEGPDSVTARAPAAAGDHPGAMIEARGLTRSYGDFYAVRDISFTIGRGEVVAFLGPNGAGKSTTMKMLTGVLAPTRGEAVIAGLEVRAHRLEAARQLGYLPESGPLYPDMTPRTLLRFFARVRGMSAAESRERLGYVVDQCRLGEVIGKPIGKLSKGYRQR